METAILVRTGLWWVETGFACFCDGSSDSSEDRALVDKTSFVDKNKLESWIKTSFACFCDRSSDSGRVRGKALCVETFFVRLTITGFG